MARHPSPLGSRRPRREELSSFEGAGLVPDELYGAPQLGLPTRLLIVGINPGLWSAAVNAPFAHPGNRFWPSLAASGLTEERIDVTAGMSDEDEDHLARRGLALTNLVNRATAKASELGAEELRIGALRAVALARSIRPRAVAIIGITAFRTAFGLPRASLGRQDPAEVTGALDALHPGRESAWPDDVALWVVPQPSGLNAHATPESLAATWREVAADAGIDVAESRGAGERNSE